jgi:hypothetical protein
MRHLLVALMAMSFVGSGHAAANAADVCATPAAVASPVAGHEACEWDWLIAAINAGIAGADDDRFSVAESGAAIDSKYVPPGWVNGVTWRAELPAGGGAHWVSLLEYESTEALARYRVEFELALRAEFFVPAVARALEEADACFTLLREESARGVCLLERDNRLIVGYSFFETDIVEGQLQTALALARLIDDALQAVDDGERLG